MYHGQTQKFLKTLPALAMAALATWNVAAADPTLVFNYPNGFAGASSVVHAAWSAGYSGSIINLTSRGQEHEAGQAWYVNQQDITSFSTDFTFQIHPSGTVPTIQGITFTIQNTNSSQNSDSYGINAGSDANLAGFGSYDLSGQQRMQHSVAVLFNLNANAQNNYPAGGTPNATGLFINGGPYGALVPEVDLNPSGINLYAGHVMAAHIVYDGSILTMTLLDTSTNAQYRTSWPIDIPAVLGSTKGWVGFTGGEIPPEAQNILSWDFYEGYATRLATPTFSLTPGEYASSQSVSVSVPSGSTVYYTTNGRQPTTSSTRYSGPISVSSSEVLQAVAVQSGYTDSNVGVANYQIAPAGSPLINFPSGFAGASNLVTTNGTAKINGSSLQLTDAGTLESASAWYVVPVNVQSFTTNFTLADTNAWPNGMTFTIQNMPPTSSDTSVQYVSGGPNALGNSQTGFGYSGSTNGVGGQIAGLASSVAIKFDKYTGSGNSTGLYTNGADLGQNSVDMSSSGMSLKSGNPVNVTLAYNGSTLSMTARDTKSGSTYTKSWSIDIPGTVGASTAYVGFTASTGWNQASAGQAGAITAWTYSTSTGQSPAVPAAPTNLRVQ